MRRLKNRADIEKIEAMLSQVGSAFSFVPFEATSIYVHNLCLQSRFFPYPQTTIILFVFQDVRGGVTPRPPFMMIFDITKVFILSIRAWGGKILKAPSGCPGFGAGLVPEIKLPKSAHGSTYANQSNLL